MFSSASSIGAARLAYNKSEIAGTRGCICMRAWPVRGRRAEASVYKGCAVARNMGDVLTKASTQIRAAATGHNAMVPSSWCMHRMPRLALTASAQRSGPMMPGGGSGCHALAARSHAGRSGVDASIAAMVAAVVV